MFACDRMRAVHRFCFGSLLAAQSSCVNVSARGSETPRASCVPLFVLPVFGGDLRSVVASNFCSSMYSLVMFAQQRVRYPALNTAVRFWRLRGLASWYICVWDAALGDTLDPLTTATLLGGVFLSLRPTSTLEHLSYHHVLRQHICMRAASQIGYGFGSVAGVGWTGGVLLRPRQLGAVLQRGIRGVFQQVRVEPCSDRWLSVCNARGDEAGPRGIDRQYDPPTVALHHISRIRLKVVVLPFGQQFSSTRSGFVGRGGAGSSCCPPHTIHAQSRCLALMVIGALSAQVIHNARAVLLPQCWYCTPYVFARRAFESRWSFKLNTRPGTPEHRRQHDSKVPSDILVCACTVQRNASTHDRMNALLIAFLNKPCMKTAACVARQLVGGSGAGIIRGPHRRGKRRCPDGLSHRTGLEQAAVDRARPVHRSGVPQRHSCRHHATRRRGGVDQNKAHFLVVVVAFAGFCRRALAENCVATRLAMPCIKNK